MAVRKPANGILPKAVKPENAEQGKYMGGMNHREMCKPVEHRKPKRKGLPAKQPNATS